MITKMEDSLPQDGLQSDSLWIIMFTEWKSYGTRSTRALEYQCMQLRDGLLDRPLAGQRLLKEDPKRNINY